MFKELMRFWAKDDLLKQAFSDANKMLATVRDMFIMVSNSLLSGKPVQENIHKRDKEVNEMEREVRRKVLEHLSINPQQDIAAGLVLTSVVISIERIGDYSKNVKELVDLYQKEFSDVQYMMDLRQATRTVEDVFDLVAECFRDGDVDKARLAIDAHKTVRQACDGVIEHVLQSQEESDIKRAVVGVLYARYLKRVSAHLKTIATIPKPKEEYPESGYLGKIYASTREQVRYYRQNYQKCQDIDC